MLDGLNSNQREAVTSPADGKLQIIAGPGTGKTKVLVCRVVYLLVECQIPPHRIIVTTFTKKAANEMVERLGYMLGSKYDLSKLIIGTFHSICYRIIVTYGSLIQRAGFKIADERDSNHILGELAEKCSVASFKEAETAAYKKQDGSLDERKIKRQISKLKSGAISTDSYAAFSTNKKGKFKYNPFIHHMYTVYQASLFENKLLDFDDCLFVCHELISCNPVLQHIDHVLVDEFQDTNEIQLQLMYEFAKSLGNLTIVGDPDQSIYGFRDAQVINFQKMIQYYGVDGIRQISLDENYRSTTGILDFSESIMSGQKGHRFPKNLKSQCATSFKPVYFNLNSQQQEAEWICTEIQALCKLPQSLINYQDISILVRSSFQTKTIEDELVKRRIPYLMVRGKAFWDRKEVLGILDYLRVSANENDRIAYLRTINYPKRGIGESSLAIVKDYLNSQGTTKTAFSCLQDLVDKKAVGYKLSKSSTASLKRYLETISKYHSMIQGNDSLDDIFESIFEGSGLKNEISNSKNPEEAMGNIMEVKKQLCEFVPVDDVLPGVDDEFGKGKPEKNIIEMFVQSIGLHETSDSQSKDNDSGKVSLSTIHGSKGLEWPVVFVPGLSEGILPAKFAIDQGGENEDEERRCFYVATTRAKALLYISSFTEEREQWFGGKEVSRFLKGPKERQLPAKQYGYSTLKNLKDLYGLMGKRLDEIFDIEKFRYDHQWDDDNARDKRRNEDYSEYKFASAKSMRMQPTTAKGERKPDRQLILSMLGKEKKSKSGAPFIPPKKSTIGYKKSRSIDVTAKINYGSPLNVREIASSVRAGPTMGGPPSVTPNPATSISETSTGAGGVARAPAYTPVRKVPQSLSRLKKLHSTVKKK